MPQTKQQQTQALADVLPVPEPVVNLTAGTAADTTSADKAPTTVPPSTEPIQGPSAPAGPFNGPGSSLSNQVVQEAEKMLERVAKSLKGLREAFQARIKDWAAADVKNNGAVVAVIFTVQAILRANQDAEQSAKVTNKDLGNDLIAAGYFRSAKKGGGKRTTEAETALVTRLVNMARWADPEGLLPDSTEGERAKRTLRRGVKINDVTYTSPIAALSKCNLPFTTVYNIFNAELRRAGGKKAQERPASTIAEAARRAVTKLYLDLNRKDKREKVFLAQNREAALAFGAAFMEHWWYAFSETERAIIVKGQEMSLTHKLIPDQLQTDEAPPAPVPDQQTDEAPPAPVMAEPNPPANVESAAA